MNTKRIASIVVVALLLAGLPGITAVLAQEQDPPPGVILQGDPEMGLPVLGPEAQAPVNSETMPPTQSGGKEQIGTSDSSAVAEPGESQAPAYNVQETENNNTRATANLMRLGDVMRGKFYPAGDVDYFKFYLEVGGQILFDIDARSIGSTSDSKLTLYNANNEIIGFNDDADGITDRDSLLFRVPTPGWYYLKVQEYGGVGCASACYYNLIISSPLLISAQAANLGTGNVAGIPFRSEDVLAHSDLNNGQEKWVMFLDGSDVGFTKDLKNVSTGWVSENGSSASLVVSFGANVTLTDRLGVQRVYTPWDVAVFDILNVGSNSQIANVEYYAGAANGLSGANEKIDAIAMTRNLTGSYYVTLSTTGAASVPKRGGGTLKPADEDLFWATIRRGQSGWTYGLFDFSLNLPGIAAEDVIACDSDVETGFVQLVILGNGNVNGNAVTQKDIFELYDDGPDAPAYFWRRLAWRGPEHGWNYNIDAIQW